MVPVQSGSSQCLQKKGGEAADSCRVQDTLMGEPQGVSPVSTLLLTLPEELELGLQFSLTSGRQQKSKYPA